MSEPEIRAPPLYADGLKHHFVIPLVLRSAIGGDGSVLKRAKIHNHRKSAQGTLRVDRFIRKLEYGKDEDLRKYDL